MIRAIALLALIALSVPSPCPAEALPDEPLPDDPLQRASAKALRGDFGPLQPWQRQWYERVQGAEIAPVTVNATQYGLWDPQRYKGDTYHIACNVLPRGTVVWLEATGMLHVVTNRGASSNDRTARGKPWYAAYWIDVWTKYRGQYGWERRNSRMYVLGRAPGW